MNRVDENINKDMTDSELIDVESLDLSDEQTWLYKVPEDSTQKVDILDWILSCDWPYNDDNGYLIVEKQLYSLLDDILKSDVLSLPDKHKFDSRTYVKPKKRVQRPSIQNIVEVTSNPSSITPCPAMGAPANKYLTYNKYSMPLGPVSPMLRLKTFNVDTNTDNSLAVKEYAMKRRSLVQDDDPQLEDFDATLVSNTSDRPSIDPAPSKPINIDLSQPAHNLHNTFNKGLTNIMNERGSLGMYQSGESLMRMSPPSLVSSLLMESSGTFNPESIESRKSAPSHRESGVPLSGRESIDPMMMSMTLSILDEKDMNTSFLSQTTYPDNDSLMDSLPPSLVSSVNSSYIVSNTPKHKPDPDTNIFSSATFTHLEQSEKLLSARPRCQLYNNLQKRDPSIRNSESYTKSREEACQNDNVKILNENNDNKETPIVKANGVEMSETITLHYSNNKFRKDNDAEKENFERDDAFYKDMGIPKQDEVARNSLNAIIGKQELNEIIQARQKLSLARKALPAEPDKPLPNQVDMSVKTIHLPNQTITVPRQSMENASELLSRRRLMNGGMDKEEIVDRPARETPKRNATFKKPSPRPSAMDTTVVYVKADENQMIDINSATMNLIDSSEKTPQTEEWCLQERAMVGSSESTDTGTFSSSSPPDSVPEHIAAPDARFHVASTPLNQHNIRRVPKAELMKIDTDLSPIFGGALDDKSYITTKVPSTNSTTERTFDMHNTTVINSATMVKKSVPKRDIMSGRVSSDNRLTITSTQKSPTRRLSPTSAASYGSLVPPAALPRKTNLPTSKLRQYSSHRELSRIPAGNPTVGPRGASGRTMIRRGVYASNPVLSPTTSTPPAGLTMPVPPVHTDSYTITGDHQKVDEKIASKPVMHNPPPLVRQGTETLRRERPPSQLVAPRDPPTVRPYSVAGAMQMRVTRPVSNQQKPVSAPVIEQPRATSGAEPRLSALPRPSRLPAPRRSIRPPSVYSVAPAADIDQY